MHFSRIYEIFTIDPSGDVNIASEQTHQPPHEISSFNSNLNITTSLEPPSQAVDTAIADITQQLTTWIELLKLEQHPMLLLVERHSKRLLSLLEEVRGDQLTADQRERRLQKAVRLLEKYKRWLCARKVQEEAKEVEAGMEEAESNGKLDLELVRKKRLEHWSKC